VNGTRAAAHPNAIRETPRKGVAARKKHGAMTGGTGEGPTAESGGRGMGGQGKAKEVETQQQGPRRRGLPVSMPSAPPIINEEEEEDE
jgi:hypothetical protein